MLDDIRDLLADNDEQLTLVGRIYAEGEESGIESRRLRPRIKNVVENQRSILDYLAHEVHQQHGIETKAKVYYPFASSSEKFAGDIDGRMPGVRKARPDIAEAIKRHQPFNHDWMIWLNYLRNESGHRTLSKQRERKTTRTLLHLRGGGTSSIQDIGVIGSDGEPVHPSAVFSGVDSYTDVTVTVWTFDAPSIPSMPSIAAPTVLAMIEDGIRTAVADIAQAAGL